MKKSFVLYADLIHTTNKLSNEQTGELFKLILSYANDDQIQIDNLLLEIAFEPIKQQMERDKIKWADTLQKRKEAGSLGGQAKAANVASARGAKQKLAKGSKAKQDLANLAVNVNVTDNVSVTENVTDTVKEKITKKKSVVDFDFSNWPEQPTDEFIKNVIIANRKSKKLSPITQSIIDKTGEQLKTAMADCGCTYSQCIDEWELKGWGSFLAKYMQNSSTQKPHGQSKPEKFNVADYYAQQQKEWREQNAINN